MLFFALPNDPNVDPAALLFFSAQTGSIRGMEQAIERDPKIIYAVDVYECRSALHHAAASTCPASVDSLQWLLKKGVPWSAQDDNGYIAEDLVRFASNEKSREILREWAVRQEYELYYKSNRVEDHPDDGKPFKLLRLDKHYDNDRFCKSLVQYTNPHGAPEDEEAMITFPEGTGIMMEWERPIMRETARLLLDGMPKSGLRILNIGFGLGMIDTYFQDAQPAEHVVIEGHPTCLGWMRHKGWYDRPNVRILEGRWQDFFTPSQSLQSDVDSNDNATPSNSSQVSLPSGAGSRSDVARPANIGKFDIVYFDTFNEGYRGHLDFIKHVPRLLRGPNSRFSFFNGHAAMARTQYQIYAEVARLHQNDVGLNTEWSEVYPNKQEMWYNIKKRGKLIQENNKYLIPICALAPTVPRYLVSGVGWNSYPRRADSDGQVLELPSRP